MEKIWEGFIKLLYRIVGWFYIEKSEFKKYGWVPSLPDFRDWLLSESGLSVQVPAAVDLRPLCSPVEDQGNLGSCTANALAGAVQFLEIKDKDKYMDLSRLFIYYNERAIEGTVKSDSGAMIRDGIKSLAKQGVCPESEWPYNISKFKTKPPIKCYTDALKDVILSYYKIITIIDMKTALAAGYPFVFGIPVYSSFESANATQTGIIPMPKKGESLLGGHAILCVGYDDSKQWFIFKNSWGSSWGAAGYGYLPYDYMTGMASDMWVISKDKGL